MPVPHRFGSRPADLTPVRAYSVATTATNKVKVNTANINLYFNIIKSKSVYQTIVYNNICSCLKLSLLSLLIMSKADWLGNQQLAMFTCRLMCLHVRYCFRLRFSALYTTITSRHGYMFQIIS